MNRATKFSILAIVLFFIGVEVHVERHHASYFPWYSTYFRDVRQSHHIPDVILLGSSRVPAAVDAGQLKKEAFGEGSSCDVQIYARGYSTIALHYYAMKRILEEGPQEARKRVFLIEAPHGFPVSVPVASEWVHKDAPYLARDIFKGNRWAFFRDSTNTVPDKIHVTVLDYLNALAYFAKEREGVNTRLDAFFERPAAGPNHLDTGGGVRVEEKAQATARANLARLVREGLVHQGPLTEAELYFHWQIVELGRQHGADVVFFTMPVSPVQALEYATPLRQSEAATVKGWIERHGSKLIETEFPTVSDNFPDSWHMSAEKKPEYTQDLSSALKKAGVFDGLECLRVSAAKL